MALFLKFFFVLTPFFALSMFLAMTAEYSTAARRKLALQVGFSTWIICMILLFFGLKVFEIFGITIDAFRIGGGFLLLLSGLGLVNSRPVDKLSGDQAAQQAAASADNVAQIAVVPLAMPIIIGPASIAALMLEGAELTGTIANGAYTAFCISAAVASVTLILYVGGWLEHKIGRMGLVILSKVTGLILVTMAAQLMITGIKAFFPTL